MFKPMSIPWMIPLSDSNMDLYLQSELLVFIQYDLKLSVETAYTPKSVY